jgi:3-oxoacyl-[acyl-carrier protein] reductase
MDLQLKGKKVFVTGSSRGLGFATARLFGAEGADIAINSRDPMSLTNAANRIREESSVKVVPLAGDVTQTGTPDELIRQAADQLGGLDILVTNAGGPPPGSFESFDDSAWQKAFDSCFMSHARLIRSALPYLKKSMSPSVLAITSVSVKQPIQDLILSNSLRSAVIGLIKTLALELGSEGIRFNSILPGWTTTERVQSLLSNRAVKNHSTIEIETHQIAQSSPLGRLASPEEFARVAVFLASPAASYMTGAMISVDGGSYKGIY